jgi:subtilisin family serine protease
MSEYEAIAAHPEVRVFVAAGNEGADLAVKPYFPAAYPLSNIYAIGNGFSEEDRAPTSSFGKRVKYWEDGQNVESSFPLWKCGYYDRPAGKDCQVKLSGTSMSAAIFTGKWLREIR